MTSTLGRLETRLVIRALREGLRRTPVRILGFLAIGGGFLLMAFRVVTKILLHFQSFAILGPALNAKLLYMIFLTFFTMLMFSNIVVAISTCYLSNELDLLLSSPLPRGAIIRHKFSSTLFQSSWMILLIAFPIFLAYARVFHSPFWTVGAAFLLLIPFFVIATASGLLLVAPLMRLVPAQRTRQIVAFISVAFMASLTVLFRWLQPERLTNPDDVRTTLQFLADLQAPTSSYLPSTWIGQSLLALFQQSWTRVWEPLALLILVSGAMFGLTMWMLHHWYFPGWCHAQESSIMKLGTGLQKPPPTRLPTTTLGVLFFKDGRLLRRDPFQWPQLLLLASIASIYLINMYHLPLHRFQQTEYITLFRSLIFFLNMGFAAFVIAAVAVRFSFPSISLEGKSIWLLRSSPITPVQLVLGKFFMYLFPLLLLACGLTIISCKILHIDAFMTWLSMGTVLLLTTGIVGLSVGLGALFPKFDAPSASEISTGWGGLVFMLLAMAYIAATIVAEAGPVQWYYRLRLAQTPLDTVWPLVLMGGAVLTLALVATWLPLFLGARHLGKGEHP